MRSAPPATADAALLDAVPEALARRALALPVRMQDGVLHVRSDPAASDPTALEEIRVHVGAHDVTVETHPDTLLHLLSAYARHTLRGDPQLTSDAVRTLDALLDLAIGSGASDVHLVPTADGLHVRQRIDGDLHGVLEVPSAEATPLVARTKVRADLDVAERRRPQDGRFSHAVPGGEVDVRVATLPTRFGERVTLRLLPHGPGGVTLGGLGLPTSTVDALEEAIAATHGLVLVCGPTGSGKTTTLHALLARLTDGPRNIVTLEDPIERIVPGASQTQIDASHGLGFTDGLRHLLRHDPDVMLVGEIRDRETAHLAIEAAHTGHLVLSSLHAVDAPGALTRLAELGIPGPMLADTVRVVVAQRLLAVPCPDCSGSGADGDGADGNCPACSGAGTRGRSAVAETLVLDEQLQERLRDGRGPASHHRALSSAVSPRLREVALARVASGTARRDDALRGTPSPIRVDPTVGTLGRTPSSSTTTSA